MKDKKDKSLSINSLLTAASQREKQIQTIKNVTEPIPSVAPETTIDHEQEEVTKVITVNNETPAPVTKKGNSINFIFENNTYPNMEAVRISADLHRKIKLMATGSGTPIAIIITNILKNFFDENEKEIQAYLKKLL